MAASVHTVRVGCSVQGTPSKSFHSLRYNFKPESIVSGGVGSLNVLTGTDGSSAVQVELPSTNGDRPHYFSGTQSTSKDVDCVLVWDEERQCYVLERLSSGVRLNSSRSKPAHISSSLNGSLTNHKRASSAPAAAIESLSSLKRRKLANSESPDETDPHHPRKRHHSEVPNNNNYSSSNSNSNSNSSSSNSTVARSSKTVLQDDRFEEFDDHEALRNARSSATPPRNNHAVIGSKTLPDRSGIATTPQARRMSPLDVVKATHRSSPLASPSNAAMYPDTSSSEEDSDSESESDMDMFAATLNEGLSRASQPV